MATRCVRFLIARHVRHLHPRLPQLIGRLLKKGVAVVVAVVVVAVLEVMVSCGGGCDQ